MSNVHVIEPQEIQPLLRTLAGRFAAVEFIKKNGDRTVKVVQPAAAPFHLVAKPTPAGKKAAKSRAANNLSLVNYRTARGNWVSFDLGKVESIRANGATYYVR